MELRYCLNQGILERISKILGDTSNGLTGSDCHVRSKSAYYISVHQKFINKQQCC